MKFMARQNVLQHLRELLRVIDVAGRECVHEHDDIGVAFQRSDKSGRYASQQPVQQQYQRVRGTHVLPPPFFRLIHAPKHFA